MYDHILVPVKDSGASTAIIPLARVIAEPLGADVTLLHVTDSLEGPVAADLGEVAAANGLDLRVVETKGDVAATILATAAATPATLIAMVTPGHSDAMVSVLGSTARAIVRGGHEPVLLYRATAAPSSFTATPVAEVILPLDGSTVSESMRLEAVGWARSLGARLTIIHVLPESVSASQLLETFDVLDTNYATTQARKLKRQFGIDVDYQVFYGDPAARIGEYVGDRTDVLGVIATRGQHPIHATLTGSVTTALIRHAGIPLVVRAPRATDLDTATLPA